MKTKRNNEGKEDEPSSRQKRGIDMQLPIHQLIMCLKKNKWVYVSIESKRVIWSRTKTYSDLGYHHPKHQAFSWVLQTPVSSYTHGQTRVSSSQTPTLDHTVHKFMGQCQSLYTTKKINSF